MKNAYIRFIGILILVSSILLNIINVNAFDYRDFSEQRKGRDLWGKKVITTSTEIKLNQIIDSVDVSVRGNFILKVLKRLYDLELNVENNETNLNKKVKKITFYGEIRDIMEQKLYYLKNVSSPNNPSYTNTSGIFSIYVSPTKITNTTISATVTSNRSGIGYYVVLPRTSAVPSPEQVKSGTDGVGRTASFRGYIDLLIGNSIINVTGLDRDTVYTLYFIGQDNAGYVNASVFKLPFQTTNTLVNYDQSLSVTLNSVTNTSVSGNINSSVIGKGYYIVLPSSYATPTSDKIRYGIDNSGYAAPFKGSLEIKSGTNTFTVDGLIPNISYKLYILVDDYTGKPYFDPLVLPFVSSQNYSSPLSAFSINIASTTITNTTFNSIITSNRAGVGYYVILPSSSNAPISSQIKAGTDSAGYSAVYKGSLYLSSGNTEFNVTGLSQNTSYTLYLIAEDTSMNMTTSILNLPFRTANVTANTNNNTNVSLSQQVYLNINNITASSINGIINTNVSGRGYYVILPSTSAAPSSIQIKNGYLNTSNIYGNIYLYTGNTDFNIAGLKSKTNYVMYFTSVDYLRNLQPTPISIPFTTK